MTQDDTAASPSLLASLLSVAAGYAARAAELLADCSLTVDRWRVLELVDRRAGVTMSSLASELGVPSSTATRIVDHLVSEGALHRVVDRADRRRVVLKTTERGRATALEAARLLTPLESDLARLVPGTGTGTARPAWPANSSGSLDGLAAALYVQRQLLPNGSN